MSNETSVRQKGLNEEILLLRYKENCDQARQHETLRERTTATIGATVGVLLGVLGLKNDCALPTGRLACVIAGFIVLLGVFGIAASWLFDNRARLHRAAIRNILQALKAPEIRDTNAEETKQLRFVWIWYSFHGVIVLLGIALLTFTCAW